eukprot:PhM_4_TR4311/c0_g1_i1/m.16077
MRKSERTLVQRLIWSSVIVVALLAAIPYMESHTAACQTAYTDVLYINVLPAFAEKAATTTVNPENPDVSTFLGVLATTARRQSQEVVTAHVVKEMDDVVYLDTPSRELAQHGMTLILRTNKQYGALLTLKRYTDHSVCEVPLTAQDEDLIRPPTPAPAPLTSINEYVHWGHGGNYFVLSQTYSVSGPTNTSKIFMAFEDLFPYFPGMRLLPVQPRDPLLPVHGKEYEMSIVDNATVVHQAHRMTKARFSILREKSTGKVVSANIRLNPIATWVLGAGGRRISVTTPSSEQASEQFFQRLITGKEASTFYNMDSTTTERSWALYN